MNSPRSVIVCGAGCINAAGATLAHCMDAMRANRGAPTLPTHFACEQSVQYPVFEVSDAHILRNVPGFSRSVCLLLTVLEEAFGNCGTTADALRGMRVGVCIGTSVGASLNFLNFYKGWKQGKTPEAAPLHQFMASNPAEAVARTYGFNGPVQTVTNACTSGTDAIGIGASWIRHGFCDVVIAGGTDEISEISYNGFARLMVTSPEPCRPFDRFRQGLNLGEGAAVLLLASEEAAARSRAARLGYISGYGTCGDAHHLTAPHPDARGLRMALKDAFRQAEIEPGAIGCINAHGTGTLTNDIVEGAVLAELFPGTPVSATKGFTGHTLGAAGAIEAAFTLACLQSGSLPPSKGFSEIDPEIGFAPIADNTPFPARFALSQSLAFGGNNSVLILEKEAGL